MWNKFVQFTMEDSHTHYKTRMHSSRMRTGRSLTVCQRPALGGCLLLGGVSAPGGSGACVCALGGVCSGGVCSGGCLFQGRVCSQGDVSSQGVSAPGDVSAPRGVSAPRRCLLKEGGMSTPRGVSAPRGCLLLGGRGIPACTEADTPPPVDRITDACKNITLATTSLRPIINVATKLLLSTIFLSM